MDLHNNFADVGTWYLRTIPFSILNSSGSAVNAQVSSMSAQMNRARISKDDFSEAAEYLGAMRSRQPVAVKRALALSAIVAYARPFTKNEDTKGNRATPFFKASPSRTLNQSEHDLHMKLLALRNEALAHSQYDRKPMLRVRGSSGGFIMKGRPFDILSEPIDYKLFGVLCSKMEKHCVSQLFELNRKLLTIEAKP